MRHSKTPSVTPSAAHKCRPVHKELRPSCTPKRTSCRTVMSHSNCVTLLTHIYTKASLSLRPNQTNSEEINCFCQWRTVQSVNIGVLVQSVHIGVLIQSVHIGVLVQSVHVRVLVQSAHIGVLLQSLHVSVLVQSVHVILPVQSVHISGLVQSLHVSVLVQSVHVSVLVQSLHVIAAIVHSRTVTVTLRQCRTAAPRSVCSYHIKASMCSVTERAKPTAAEWMDRVILPINTAANRPAVLLNAHAIYIYCL